MCYNGAFEALDYTVQALRHNNRVMGVVLFLFTGDFRQLLPLIPHSIIYVGMLKIFTCQQKKKSLSCWRRIFDYIRDVASECW